ncbi:MAG: hypothetical protein FD174_1756 [Geobacteraceae bacterium]|nr:MAG: hypothetical protein FD174_1756 [Geobacteraceae bacterium]
MKLPRWLPIAAAVPAVIFFLLVLTIVFIPDEALQGVVARGFEREGYSFQAERFGKTFPLGIKVRNMVISGNRGALVKADEASARLRFFPLLTGRVRISYHAGIGGGSVTGDLFPQRGGEMHLEMSGVRLEDIPFFSTVTGAQVKGALRVKGSFRGPQSAARGELQIEVKDAALTGVKIGETPLPDASYSTVQGMLRISGGKATLESLTFQGEGLYVRLRGDIPLVTPLTAAPLNLTLELMPKPELLEKQKFVFLLLVKYLSTPGHYQIPVKGTLAKPAIQ